MIKMVLPLSALPIITLPLVIFCFKFFSTCVCVLCMMLQLLLLLRICFNFLSAMMRNESWIASFGSLMPLSVSMARFVQVVAESFVSCIIDPYPVIPSLLW